MWAAGACVLLVACSLTFGALVAKWANDTVDKVKSPAQYYGRPSTDALDVLGWLEAEKVLVVRTGSDKVVTDKLDYDVVVVDAQVLL